MVDRFACDRHQAVAIASLLIGEGTAEEVSQVIGFQGLQPKEPGTTDQGFVDFEVGVLRGGPDQGEGAVLHPGQQGILLGAVEAVHLVDEWDGARPWRSKRWRAASASVRRSLTPASTAFRLLKWALVDGDDPRQGGFADSRWAMEQQVANTIDGDGTS